MNISAFGCGKVILFGEHAVVHQHPALAAALDLGVSLTRALPSAHLEVLVDGWTPTQPHDGTRLGEALARIQRTVTDALGPIPPTTLHMRCDLPPGAGLGSSAAWAVAVAQACCLLANPHQPAPAHLILQAADAAERVFHGNPSGVDHTTSALGGVLWFQRGQPHTLQPLDIEPIPVIIAQIEPGADTALMVSRVQQLLDQAPRVAQPLLQTLGELSRHARASLEARDLDALGRWMNIAHGALTALDVSTPALDAACHAARRAGASGAKLTGAGGGGCLLALAPPEHTDAVADALRQQGALLVSITRAGHARRDLALTPGAP